MKKSLFTILCLVLLSLSATAQVRIGFFSYETMLKAMPEYPQMQEELRKLRSQYDDETKRSEEEFNAKYEEFLDSYSTLATSIRRKRQTELQQLMESNIKFRDEARRLLRQAEDDAMAPLQQRLDATIRSVAQKHGFTFMLNTDSHACPYIDPAFGEDVSNLLKEALK